MKNYEFAHYLTSFFTVHLSGHLNVSQNTISSYRDTFTKLLNFFKETKNIAPEKLKFTHINRSAIEEFLFWLEAGGSSKSTINQRLAAVRSFFRYVQIERPDLLLHCTNIINIKGKKHPKPTIQFLVKDEIKLLLAQPDTNIRDGRRDLAILSVLYDSAARVSEICDLSVRSLHLDSPPTIKLTGKWSKSRIVPLSAPNADILRKYVTENKLDKPEYLDEPLFKNRLGNKLTRGGISYILTKYIEMANKEVPNTISEGITPHCLRHSKAMHLLEAGVNLIYIRDFLGHEDIETTQMYAKVNPETKRAALIAAFSDVKVPIMHDWNDDQNLMSFLKGLKS